MERKSTSKKIKTRLVHFSWLGALIIAALVFTRCYEWTTIDQPDTAAPNSSFDVRLVMKPTESSDFGFDLFDEGVYGIQLPEGWTVKNDSFMYNIKGINNADQTPFQYESYVVYDQFYATMYEDSIPSDAGYYWWGGLSDSARVDNLDSIYIEITINTDADEGEFFLQYAIGTLDGDDTYPARNISDKVPITISAVNVKRYLKKQLNVYPNPASELLNIDLGDIEEGAIQLYNTSGQLKYEESISRSLMTIDISNYPVGTYFLKVSNGKGSYAKKVLIK
jgi:hypothetical protein